MPQPRTRQDRPESYSRHETRYRKKRHTFRNVMIVILILAAVFGTCYFIFLQSAKKVATDAANFAQSANTLQANVVTGKNSDAQTTAKALASQASDMKKETSGILWTIGSYVPVYGRDLAKARTAASTLDDLTANALVPVTNSLASTSLSSIVKSDGTVDTAAAQQLATALGNAAPVVQSAASTFDSLGDVRNDELSSALTRARDQLDGLSSTFTVASEVAPIVPSLLGANNQKRSYLVVMQNTAESRATGGAIATWGLLTIDNGKLSFGDFSILDGDGGVTSDDPLAFTGEETTLFGSNVATTASDVNVNPDFPRSAQLLDDLWSRQKNSDGDENGKVDGVIALDPFCLQGMLGLVGSVQVDDTTTLDGSNCATMLLHDMYSNITTASKQSAYLVKSTALVCEKFITSLGNVDLSSLTSTMGDMTGGNHLQMWLSNTSEQSALTKVGCTGALGTDETNPAVGIYFNDNTGSKLNWYLSTDVKEGTVTKNPNGSTNHTITVTFTNNLAEGDVYDVGSYILAQSSTSYSSTSGTTSSSSSTSSKTSSTSSTSSNSTNSNNSTSNSTNSSSSSSNNSTNSNGTSSTSTNSSSTNNSSNSSSTSTNSNSGTTTDNLKRGEMSTTVYIYAPAGGFITGLKSSDGFTLTQGTYNGLQVYYGKLDLTAEGTATVTFMATTSTKASGSFTLHETPTCTAARTQ